MAKKPNSKSKANPTAADTKAQAHARTHAAMRLAKAAKNIEVERDEPEDEEPVYASGFSVVGIGASAGGFEAFLQLLENLPLDTGMAYVLVQHLDPNHESKLSELLARSTRLPVHEVRQNMTVQPNRVYVMPQNVNMAIEDCRLRLQPRKNNTQHMPVDFFFRSLAEDRENRAIGIVLSGTGSDGTLGLQAIKGAGGITFAQDEKSAKYFGMPGSALAAGCVDIVLPPNAMGRELARLASHPYVGRARLPLPPAGVETADVEKTFRQKDDELIALFSMLRARTGVDFSLYKHSTLRRRILRRMLLHKIDTFNGYLTYLRAHPQDVDALFNDLLINVTGFFRDPQVFRGLKKRIFPKLLRERENDHPLRLWVCGCSTGEEAYSMAISLVEFFETTNSHINAQIFATDISEAGVEKARAGIYPENITLDVSPERLRRFFVRTNGHYQVAKSIRDMCIFARQNVIVDPPFSSLDLISCRNVLIYLGQALQRKVLPTFHYALKPNGYLLLGSSETIGGASDLFTLLDKKSKVYTKKSMLGRPGLPEHLRPYQPETSLARNVGASLVQPKAEPKAPDFHQYVDRLLLTRWSPAAVVVNSQLDVLLFRGRTGAFLEHTAGNASLNLLKMARESLVADLRSAISRAARENTTIKQENAIARFDNQFQRVTIEVSPFEPGPGTDRFFLVLFREVVSAPETDQEKRGSTLSRARQETYRRELANLRQELATSKESLQGIIEEQEATNEELKSANEEIQSSNEELQSTNEELETAKEELQSTNEELTTLNEELQTRNLELSHLNNDLTNLLASVNIAIIILSNDLTIRRFTPMAERIFNLIPSDIGRRLSDLNRNIIMPDLERSLQEVVDNLATIEREVQDREGRWFALRIRPYRTGENKIDGAVILLSNIDEQKRIFELVVDSVTQPVVSLHSDLRVRRANAAFYEAFQTKPEETENQFIYRLGDGQWNVERLRRLLEEVLPKQREVKNFELDADFPKVGRRVLQLNARGFSEDGQSNRFILLSIKDMGPDGEMGKSKLEKSQLPPHRADRREPRDEFGDG